VKAVRKEGNVYVVDFAKLAGMWLPEGVQSEANEEKFTSPLVKSYWEKRKNFFKQAELEEAFSSILEFLDLHKNAEFKRGSVTVNLLEHSLRTADFSFAISGSLPEEERAVLVLAALLHDAGKATVDEKEMKRHPEYSFEIAQRLGLLNEEWDRVVKEADPLELQKVRAGNLISYLVRYHHESTVPATDSFSADESGTLKRLLMYLKKADSAAAKLESGEARNETEALEMAAGALRRTAKKVEARAEEELARKEVRKEQVTESKLLQFFSLIERGINQPADMKTAAKLYGYTMTTRPLVALMRERVFEVARGLLGTTTIEELEEVLKPFSLEDGRVLRPCIFRSYPNAPGKRQLFLVVNWEKVRELAGSLGKKLPPVSVLERRLSKARVSLIQE